MKYYIAYGSNLNKRQMAQRCPDAMPIGSSALTGYRLVFRGVATIEPLPGATVPVGVWKISASDEKKLDSYEGYPYYYDKLQMPVSVNGKTYNAMIYVMNEGHPLSRPSGTYYATIAEGYDDFNLPKTALRAALEH